MRERDAMTTAPEPVKKYQFTNREKLAEITREIALRRHVYANKVERGQWLPSKADAHLNCMVAIERDYRRLCQGEDLFAPRMVSVPAELAGLELAQVAAELGVHEHAARAFWARLIAIIEPAS